MKNIGYITIGIGIINIIRNFDIGIKVFLGLELIFIGISCLFIDLSLSFDNLYYIILAFFFIILSAIETSIGLSFILSLYSDTSINN